MSMSKSKLWMAGGALVCVLVLIASWFLLIGPKRAEAAELHHQTTLAQNANAALRLKIAKLEKQFQELDSLKSQLDAIRESMPADVAESTLLREVQGLATGTGTTFVSVSTGDATPLVDPDAATQAAPADGEATSDSESDSESDTESANASPSPTPPVATVDTAVYSVPVTFVAVSSFQGSQAFLQNLQDSMPRALLVTDLTIQARKPGDAGGGRPIAANGDVELTITGNVFVLDAPDFELDGTITENEPSATAPASIPAPSSTDATRTEEANADAPSAGPSVAAN